jgi:hypothetical protein
MTSPIRSLVLLFAALGTGACSALSDGVIEPCRAVDQVSVGGETEGINGVVTVVATKTEGRVALEITPADDSTVHTAAFDLAGADVDELVGEVTAEVGAVFAGEGSEYGYLRLTDERGVWFEGGRSPSIDGNAHGGAAIDGPFVLGDETGDACRASGGDGYDVAIHGVMATLSDASEAVLLDTEGTNGMWWSVDVRAVGVRATRGVYEEPAGTVDGLGPGAHDLVDVVGYLYRRSP